MHNKQIVRERERKRLRLIGTTLRLEERVTTWAKTSRHQRVSRITAKLQLFRQAKSYQLVRKRNLIKSEIISKSDDEWKSSPKRRTKEALENSTVALQLNSYICSILPRLMCQQLILMFNLPAGNANARTDLNPLKQWMCIQDWFN